MLLGVSVSVSGAWWFMVGLKSKITRRKRGFDSKKPSGVADAPHLPAIEGPAGSIYDRKGGKRRKGGFLVTATEILQGRWTMI